MRIGDLVPWERPWERPLGAPTVALGLLGCPVGVSFGDLETWRLGDRET